MSAASRSPAVVVVGEVDQQAAAGADERGGERGKSVGELAYRVRCADAREGVAASAVKMRVGQEKERQFRVDGIDREECVGGVEGPPRVSGVAGCGEGFAVGGGEPGS